ncbi:hypothetical protein L1049_021451 [Liquidambar formosana]|uniref:Uncharacterized protein n=1 Tax=Liquidambar formosana TaxID=63359 RepID=A0AAP0R279_LIQFO
MEHFDAGDGDLPAPDRKDSPEDIIFDATQYEFFGENVVEDDLGGLEDDNDDYPFEGTEDEPFPSFNKDEGEHFGSLSDIDDLTDTFSELNKVASEARNPGDIGDRVSSPMESLVGLCPFSVRGTGSCKYGIVGEAFYFGFSHDDKMQPLEVFVKKQHAKHVFFSKMKSMSEK